MFQNSYNIYNIISHFFQIIQQFYLNFLKLFIKLEEMPLDLYALKVEIDPISEYINTKKKMVYNKI